MKDQDKEALKIFVIIILFIIFMGILLGVLSKPRELQFIITKEVCENGTEYNHTLINEVSALQNELYDLKDKETYSHWCKDALEYNLEIEYCENFNKEYKKLLEQVILKEIQIEENIINVQICGQVLVDEMRFNLIEECFNDECPPLEAVMKKEGITIGWLEENAECLDLQGNPTEAYNSCKTRSTSNEDLEKEGRCCAEQIYKIKEYTISRK